ncbi:MAG: hypothetical protein AAFP19_24400, partial [Bacteroidota bacterium]
MANFKNLAFPEAIKYIDLVSFAIITATRVEVNEVRRSLEALPGLAHPARVFKDNYTYFLGRLGKYGVVVVQSRMGAAGAGSSIITTETTIQHWQPKAILMLGIAFGINSSKQKIGDILIADKIFPYESKKVKIDNEVIFRAPIPLTSQLLADRFEEIGEDWREDYTHADNQESPSIYRGPLLSGEVLIDDRLYRDKLLDHFKEAIGGEMEASGIFAASTARSLPWLVVKAICDFGDGNKSENKTAYQARAIRAVVSLAQTVFDQENIFDGLKVKAIDTHQNHQSPIAQASPDPN